MTGITQNEVNKLREDIIDMAYDLLTSVDWYYLDNKSVSYVLHSIQSTLESAMLRNEQRIKELIKTGTDKQTA